MESDCLQKGADPTTWRGPQHRAPLLRQVLARRPDHTLRAGPGQSATAHQLSSHKHRWLRTKCACVGADPTGWRVTQHGGHGWQRERPSAGLPGLRQLPQPLASLGQGRPDEVVALASSSRWCEIMQVTLSPSHPHPALQLNDWPLGMIRHGNAATSLWDVG